MSAKLYLVIKITSENGVKERKAGLSEASIKTLDNHRK